MAAMPNYRGLGYSSFGYIEPAEQKSILETLQTEYPTNGAIPILLACVNYLDSVPLDLLLGASRYGQILCKLSFEFEFLLAPLYEKKIQLAPKLNLDLSKDEMYASSDVKSQDELFFLKLSRDQQYSLLDT